MKKTTTLPIVLIALVVGVSVAKAEPAKHRKAAIMACEEEVVQVCAKTPEEMRQCVQENLNQFSQTCVSLIEERAEAEQQIQKACSDDLQANCGGKFDLRRQGRCLGQLMKKEPDRLSEACRKAVKAAGPPPPPPME